ncbi:S8 family serine peptidase [Thiomicrospira sp. ALE5]|uniref:S8 family serine peptidase n=1 Tax=Thiomicrospira sp. ALE5 TaxID=748650 RepID=UPI0008EAD614|nr:S8 family serine peptidase [Thiomicrospira sp. ALE5]SFR63896.1 Subtilase family protein [Thiomicrospira sp. ALE5]
MASILRFSTLLITSSILFQTGCGGGGGNNVRPDLPEPIQEPQPEPIQEPEPTIPTPPDETQPEPPMNPMPQPGTVQFSAQQLRFDLNQWYATSFDGNGQTIAILDTGLRNNQTNRTLYTTVAASNERYTVVNGQVMKVNDTSLRNGTHGDDMAQIAASVDYGIAIDATIAHGVIADTQGSTNRISIFKGLEWANSLNSQGFNVPVMNLSFNYGALVLARESVSNSQLPLSEQTIRNISNQIVAQNRAIIHAAGNDAISLVTQVYNDANFADATRLTLGQHLLIVGATFDNQSLASFSNFPGHDGAIQKRFIIGPGATQVADYTLFGTSGAAANVSGLIAVMQQRWQHLGGRELTQILLDTANRDFPNYSASLHGMGMLDADAAFSPVGTTSIAFENQTYSMQSLAVSLPAGYEPVTLNTAILDSYQRDFAIQMTSVTQPRQGHFRQAFNQAWPTPPRTFSLDNSQMSLSISPQTELNSYQPMIQHSQLGFNQFAQDQQLTLFNIGLYQPTQQTGWYASVAQSSQTNQQAWLLARQQGRWQWGGYQTQGDSLLNWAGLNQRNQQGVFAIWHPTLTQDWLSVGYNWQQAQEPGTQLLTNVTETQTSQWLSLHNPYRIMGFHAQMDIYQQQNQLDFTAAISESIGNGSLRFYRQNLRTTRQNEGVSLQLQHPHWQIRWQQDQFDQAWLVRYRQAF